MAGSSQPVASPRHDHLTRQILEADIGRDSIAEALSFVTSGESIEDGPPSPAAQLLAYLSDPLYLNESITSLMRKSGLGTAGILDALRKRDIALAVASSGKRVGKVIDGLGEAAEPRWAICERCWGEGEIEQRDGEALPADDGEEPVYPMVPCPALCDNGKVRKSGDMDAAKLFLGIHGLGPKGGAGNGGTTIDKLVVSANAQAGARADGGGSERKAQQQETVTDRVQGIIEGKIVG